MGDKRSLNFIIEKYNTEKNLNKKCFYLSQFLNYVKQKETIEALIRVFQSNLRVPNSSESQGPYCNSNYLEFLAKSIKNYPYPIKSVYYPEDIEKARAWFATGPKIIINRDIF